MKGFIRVIAGIAASLNLLTACSAPRGNTQETLFIQLKPKYQEMLEKEQRQTLVDVVCAFMDVSDLIENSSEELRSEKAIQTYLKRYMESRDTIVSWLPDEMETLSICFSKMHTFLIEYANTEFYIGDMNSDLKANYIKPLRLAMDFFEWEGDWELPQIESTLEPEVELLLPTANPALTP